MTNVEFEKQVLDHLGIVKIIASRIHTRIHWTVDLPDLVNTGILGLIDAVRKYDPARGVKFSTYASLRIKGAIIDELRNLDWASRRQRQKIKAVESAFETLEAQLGRPAGEEEVAESLNMSLAEFQGLRDEAGDAGIGVFRIDSEDEANISDAKTLKYYIDETRESPDLVMEKEEMKKLLVEFIKALPEKEKLVLSLYYLEDLNLKEIGKIMDLTDSRISQLRTGAILRLRARLAEIALKNKVRARDMFGS